MKTEKYDIAADMLEHLNGKTAQVNAIDEALCELNKAAEILDAMGAFGASEVITKIIEDMPYKIVQNSFDDEK